MAVSAKAAQSNPAVHQPPGRQRSAALACSNTACPMNSSAWFLARRSRLHRKGIAQDGTHPVLLTGYGGYGISMQPNFSPLRRLWRTLSRGTRPWSRSHRRVRTLCRSPRRIDAVRQARGNHFGLRFTNHKAGSLWAR